jgi:hypothetical protein
MQRKLLEHLPSNMKDFIRNRVFLHSHRRAYLAQSWCSSPMKKLRVRQYSLRQQTQSQLQNKVLAALPSNIIDSVTQATLNLPFSWGHCEQRWYFSLLKKLTGGQYSLIQQTQVTMQSKLLDPAPSNMNDFLRSTTMFLHSLERGYSAQSWCFSPMEKLRGRQYFFTQHTRIKPQNKALAPLASNMNDSLTKATLHLPFNCMGPLWTKVMFLTLEITER